MGFFSNFMNGKEKTQAADELAAPINQAARYGLGRMRAGAEGLDKIYSEDPSQLINNQIGLENRLLRGSSDDARMRARQLIASRGMGNSSIGLGQEVNMDRDMSEKLNLNNASGMQRIRDMAIQNQQGRMQIGQQMFAPKQAQGPIQMQDQTYRTGGYGQLIGPAIQAGIAAYGMKGAGGGGAGQGGFAKLWSPGASANIA